MEHELLIGAILSKLGANHPWRVNKKSKKSK